MPRPKRLSSQTLRRLRVFFAESSRIRCLTWTFSEGIEQHAMRPKSVTSIPSSRNFIPALRHGIKARQLHYKIPLSVFGGANGLPRNEGAYASQVARTRGSDSKPAE